MSVSVPAQNDPLYLAIRVETDALDHYRTTTSNSLIRDPEQISHISMHEIWRLPARYEEIFSAKRCGKLILEMRVIVIYPQLPLHLT